MATSNNNNDHPTLPPVNDNINQQYDPESIETEKISKKKRKRMENRNCCLRCLCCACCLPKWATIIVWFIIISILIIIIVIGGIMSKFQLPTVEVLGVANSTESGAPPLSIIGNRLSVNFGLIVKAVNPNLLPIYISDMNATAYYNINDSPMYVGGGFLGKQDLPQYSNFTFIFPFSIIYDPMTDPTQAFLTDLATRCGLTGEEPQSLTVSYTITVAARVLFVTVHPTINSQSTFPCPIKDQTLSL